VACPPTERRADCPPSRRRSENPERVARPCATATATVEPRTTSGCRTAYGTVSPPQPVYRRAHCQRVPAPMAFGGDVATVTESADVPASRRSATRPSAWTSGNTQSTRISFEAVDHQHQPTAKAQVNEGFQSCSRSLNHAGNVPLQRVVRHKPAGQRLADTSQSTPSPENLRATPARRPGCGLHGAHVPLGGPSSGALR